MTNFKAKIFALIFALAFWVFIVSSGDLIYKFPEAIPVQAFNVPENLVVLDIDTIEPVYLDLNTDRETFKDLKAKDIKAYVDLTGLAAGQEHEVNVKVNFDNQKVQVRKISPEKIKIRLEEIIVKSVPIELKIDGQERLGIKLGATTLSVETAQVRGAKSKVNQAAKLMAYLTLSDAGKERVESSLPLIAVGQDNLPVEGLEISPATTDAVINLEQITNSKTVGIKVNLGVGNPEAGYFIGDVTVTPATISIQSENQQLLENMAYLLTEEVPIDKLNANLEKEVSLLLPEGIRLADSTSPRVTINVKVTSQESTREMFAGIKPFNLKPELKIEKITPTALQIQIKGAFSSMKDLTENDLYVNLDLSEYAAGTHNIMIDETMLVIPATLQINAFEESEIEIVISAAD